MADMAQFAQSLFSGEQNLSFKERALYVAGGLSLAAAGAQPRPNPLLNVLAIAGGAYFAWSGYQGRCPVKAAFLDDSEGGQALPRRRSDALAPSHGDSDR